MNGIFRKAVKETGYIQSNKRDHNYTWHEPGDDNPFNKRVLDIRDFIQNSWFVIQSKFVYEIFIERRKSTGKELVGAKMFKSETVDVNLIYLHNEPKIEGVIYKAAGFEDRWDVYAWNNAFYFTRSMTGEVVYKAFFNVTETGFTVYKIDYIPEGFNLQDQEMVINIVHFLIKTLLFGSIYPNKIPAGLKTDDAIALYSFSQFGRNCWYATYDSVLDTIAKVNLAK